MSENKTRLIDEEGGWTVINNKMRDIWIRPLGPTAFTVWYVFKSFCSGINSENIFPEVSEEDWSLRCGISTPTFIKAIKTLEEYDLLKIEKPPKEKSYLPHIYILKKIPSKLPDKIKYQKKKNEKGEEINKNLIEPFPQKCRFFDPIFDNSEKIFKIFSDTNTQGGTKNSLEGGIKNFKDIKRTDTKSTVCNNINIINKDFSNPILIQNSSRRKPVQEIKQENPSKEKKSKSQKLPFDESNWKYEILELWNKIPQVTKHRFEPGATMNEIAKYLEYLANGMYSRQCVIKDEFLKQYNIPEEYLTKKFTSREIKCAINNYEKCFIDGNYPINKKGLTKSLSVFLYNSISNMSWFLSCAANRTKPISDTLKDYNPQYTKYFIERNIINKYFSEKDYKKIYNNIQAIENRIFKDEIFDFSKPNADLWGKIGKGKGQLEPMFEKYAQFINNHNRIEDPEKIFWAYGYYFNDFLEDLKRTYSSFRVNIND